MIKYKCWTCGTDMESPESMIGQREICSYCETPNLVPKFLEVQSVSTPELCYFCHKKQADPDSSSHLNCKKEICGPSYRCRKCGARWDEPAQEVKKVKTSDAKDYKPICPSCQSKDAVPTRLPEMPIGKYYGDFKSLGAVVYEYDDIRAVLKGMMNVPRCRECMRIHTIVRRTSWVIAGITQVVAQFVILSAFDEQLKNSLTEQIGVCILIFLLVTLPVLYITRRLLMRYVISKTLPENEAETFPAVQELRRQGWEFWK